MTGKEIKQILGKIQDSSKVEIIYNDGTNKTGFYKKLENNVDQINLGESYYEFDVLTNDEIFPIISIKPKMVELYNWSKNSQNPELTIKSVLISISDLYDLEISYKDNSVEILRKRTDEESYYIVMTLTIEDAKILIKNFDEIYDKHFK